MSNITVITLNKFEKWARGCCVNVFLVSTEYRIHHFHRMKSNCFQIAFWILLINHNIETINEIEKNPRGKLTRIWRHWVKFIYCVLINKVHMRQVVKLKSRDSEVHICFRTSGSPHKLSRDIHTCSREHSRCFASLKFVVTRVVVARDLLTSTRLFLFCFWDASKLQTPPKTPFYQI